MKEEKLPKLLNELANAAAEPVPNNLAEDIKTQIPHPLAHHRRGMNTISIMIDLRIGKLTAAAVIIITTILMANFLGWVSPDKGMYQEGKLLMKHFLTGDATGRNFPPQRSDVVIYGKDSRQEDSHALVMHWKLSDGKYRVIFADGRGRTVTAEKLIKLQAQMLQDKAQ